MCLSKNVYDLQERYKLVREELVYSQKQLYILQAKQSGQDGSSPDKASLQFKN